MPLTLPRQSVRPGGRFLAFDALGELPHDGWSLDGGPTPIPLELTDAASRTAQFYDKAYARRLGVPPGTPPGTYRLTAGNAPAGVEVTVLPARPPVVTTAAYDLSHLAQRWARADVAVLHPGVYDAPWPIPVPPGKTLLAHGALIRRVWVDEPANADAPVLLPGDGCTVEGLTVEADEAPVGSPAYRTHRLLGSDAADVTLRGVTLRGGRIGAGIWPGLVAEDCRFERAGVRVVRPCVFRRCWWEGVAEHYDTELVVDAVGGVALLDCTFSGTGRGPVLRTNLTDVADVLLAGLEVTRCGHSQNACEGVSTEGTGALRRVVVMHFRYDGAGPAASFGAALGEQHEVRDFRATGYGVVLTGRQVGTVFREGELRGAVRLGPETRGVVFDRCHQIVSPPTYANQFTPPPPGVPWPDARGPVVDEGQQNDLSGLATVVNVEAI